MLLNRSTTPRDSATDIEKTSWKGAPEREWPNRRRSVVKTEEVPRKSKNERSARQMMLMAFWDNPSLVYTEFGPDTYKEKQNVTQDMYFNI